MIVSLLLLGGLVTLGPLVKNSLALSNSKSIRLYISIALLGITIFYPIWPVFILFTIFFYASISAESQVLQSLNIQKRAPQTLLFILTLLPVLVSYLIPEARIVTPQLFYIVSSAFALVASFSAKSYGEGKYVIYEKAPPLILGLLIMIGSGLIYYFTIYTSSKESSDLFILTFIMFFYSGGSACVYITLDSYLKPYKSTRSWQTH
jgi:hypothetical protein